MVNQFRFQICFAICCFCFTSLTLAQRDRDDRGDRGDRGEWDPAEYLKRADANGNGQMDPDETRGRLGDYIRKMGFNTDKPVPVADIINKARGINKQKAEERRIQAANEAREAMRQVPSFGDAPVREFEMVRNFAGEVSNYTPDQLEKKYGERIMDEVKKSLGRYDKNKNGNLEKAEIESGRWGRPSPQESDLNQDGDLSQYELAERYRLRFQGEEKNDDRDRSDRDRRDDRSGSSKSTGEDARAKAKKAAEKAREAAKAKERAEEEKRERTRSSRTGGSSSRSMQSEREKAKEAARRALEAKRGSSGSSSSGGSGSSSSSSGDRFESRTKQVFAAHDRDKDGKLNEEEVKRARLNKPMSDLDKDGDGAVSPDELTQLQRDRAEQYAKEVKTGTSSRTSNRSSSRTSSRDDSKRSSSGDSKSSRSSGSYSSRDQNRDGVIQMHEFCDKDKWTMDKIREFQELDKNSDGMLSRDEQRK